MTKILRERLARELDSARDLYGVAKSRGVPDRDLEPLVWLGRELKETIPEIDFAEETIERDAILYRVHLVTKEVARWAARARLGPRDPFEALKLPPLADPKAARVAEAALSDRCRFKLLRTPVQAQALATRVIEGGTGRARASQMLADVVCQSTSLPAPVIQVLERPRAHKLRGGRLAVELHGDYRPSRDEETAIRIFNRTARKEQEVAGKTFLDTLVHELCHHADFRILGLNFSPHCEGFYARVGHMVRSLRGQPLTARPESYLSAALRQRALSR